MRIKKARMTLVFSLPFCLLLPDGDYQVRLGEDEIVTLNLTKVTAEVYDERLPERGFIKWELENITELKIKGLEGQGEWVKVQKLKQTKEKKYVIEYKTKDGKRIVPEVDPLVIEKDVDIGGDMNVTTDQQESHGSTGIGDTIGIIPEMTQQGRKLVVNAEVRRDRFGRFRYTKVRFSSNRQLQFEEQFKVAIKAVNTLVPKYRRISGDYWITKIREEDVFMFKDVQENSPDISFMTQGIVPSRPDHDAPIVSNLRESLVGNELEPPFFQLMLDAKNAFEQANYHLSVLLSIIALESAVKTFLIFHAAKCPTEIVDELVRTSLNRLVTVVMAKIFPTTDYRGLIGGVTNAIKSRNRIIHEGEIEIPLSTSKTIIDDVESYLGFVGRKFQELDNASQ